MLLTFIDLAASRSEVFRLKWTIFDFRQNVVRLVTAKDEYAVGRADYIPMTRELRGTLLKLGGADHSFRVSLHSPGRRLCRRPRPR
jgi:hypothetical protein